MKPLFILLLQDGEPHVAINANDIKWIRIHDGQAQIVTSSTCTVAPFTTHMGQRLTEELRRRYNIVYLSERGLTRDDLGASNDILRITSVTSVINNGVTYVFPKGLKTVEIANGAVDVRVFDANGTIAPSDYHIQVTGKIDIDAFSDLLAAHVER